MTHVFYFQNSSALGSSGILESRCVKQDSFFKAAWHLGSPICCWRFFGHPRFEPSFFAHFSWGKRVPSLQQWSEVKGGRFRKWIFSACLVSQKVFKMQATWRLMVLKICVWGMALWNLALLNCIDRTCMFMFSWSSSRSSLHTGYGLSIGYLVSWSHIDMFYIPVVPVHFKWAIPNLMPPHQEKWQANLTKYCACHEKWHWNTTKYVACYSIRLYCSVLFDSILLYSTLSSALFNLIRISSAKSEVSHLKGSLTICINMSISSLLPWLLITDAYI